MKGPQPGDTVVEVGAAGEPHIVQVEAVADGLQHNAPVEHDWHPQTLLLLAPLRRDKFGVDNTLVVIRLERHKLEQELMVVQKDLMTFRSFLIYLENHKS